MARFIARARLSANNWAKQEVVRRKLLVATEEQRKVKRSRQLKVHCMSESVWFTGLIWLVCIIVNLVISRVVTDT
ncbi:Uncharacterized protein HZ326_16928 [Fusarium oxysporum f. sp. albedinis]|nr:Uncharacterized protein HZ326_16928 [Fusarium oxysporum f. sp. albedinis]